MENNLSGRGRIRLLLSWKGALAALLLACVLASLGSGVAWAGESGGGMGGFLGEGIDFKGGMLDWEEDDNGHRVAILRNYAVVILPQLTISARNMVLNVELQEIYAEGDVLFDETAGNAFYCDQLTFNYQEWKGLAKNIRVKMDRVGVDIPVRDFLDDRPSTSMSNSSSINDAGDSPNVLKRMYVQAQELRAHDNQTFELIDAKITPSSFAKPHWYFRSPAALFRHREKIESYHNTVNIGKMPVMYFPYLIRDLQYDWPWMRISGGRTSDYGYFVRSQWGWRLNTNPNSYLKMNKIIFDLDWYSRRGLGVGVETTYKVGNLESLGKLKLYGVYEYGISRHRDLERAYQDNEDRIYRDHPGYRPSLYRDDFRWAVDWEHYQQLNDKWDIRAEAHLYHDRDYLKDYDTTRYWNAKEPENSIDVRRLDKHWMLEFVASSRLSNKWETRSEYYPEVRLTVPGWQIGDMPLYVKNDFRMGVVNRRFDEDEYKYTKYSAYNGLDYPGGLFELDPATGNTLASSRLLDKDNYGSMFRVFNEIRVEAPIKLWNAMTLKPWVGLRTAYYSDTIGDPYSNDIMWEAYNDPSNPLHNEAKNRYDKNMFSPGQMRSRGSGSTNYAVPFGADLSSRFYTLFGAHDQYRLITEPIVSYRENSRPKLDSRTSLYPIDIYDDYNRQRRFGFELHTKLQRRHYEDAPGEDVPERDILDFNVAFYNYPRSKDRFEGENPHRFSAISFDLVYRPTKNLSLSFAGDYDTDDSTLNRAIASVDWRLGSMFRAFLTHYHYRGDYWRYRQAEPSSQTHLALRTKLWNDSSRYSLEGAVAYEWRDSTPANNYNKHGVRHGFNKYRLTLYRDLDTFEMAFSYVRDRNANDHGVFFNISPKSFMGFERPPPSYTIEVEALADSRYPDSVRYLGSGYLIDGPVADADLKDVQF